MIPRQNQDRRQWAAGSNNNKTLPKLPVWSKARYCMLLLRWDALPMLQAGSSHMVMTATKQARCQKGQVPRPVKLRAALLLHPDVAPPQSLLRSPV